MPFAVRLFKYKAFPQKFPITTPIQPKFHFEGEEPGEEPVTEIARLGPSEHEMYEKYMVRHEYVVKMEGKVHGRYFTECTRFDRFPCFVHSEKPWVLSSLIKTAVAERAFRRLTEHRNVTGVLIEPAELSLASAMEKLRSVQRIKGGWFGDLRIEKVEVAYLYGDQVADSADWDRYLNAGELKALHLEVPHSDDLMPIVLTRDAGIVFFANLKERDYLEYATAIYLTLEDLIT